MVAAHFDVFIEACVRPSFPVRAASAGILRSPSSVLQRKRRQVTLVVRFTMRSFLSSDDITRDSRNKTKVYMSTFVLSVFSLIVRSVSTHRRIRHVGEDSN